MEKRDFLIIGAGPAGLSAAATAARYGVRVTVFSDDPRIGGQIFRQPVPPLSFRVAPVDVPDKAVFERLENSLKDGRVEFHCESVGWGFFDGNTIAAKGGGDTLWKAKHILIAEGAYEQPAAFPGWNLPGVMNLGGLQGLLKSQGIVPEGRVVIAGTGPLLFYTAAQLVKNGVDVAAVIEASPFSRWMKWSMRLVRAPRVLFSGLRYALRLAQKRIPVHYGAIVTRASGEGRLKSISFSRADGNWRPRPGTEKTIATDYLCMNFGFIPSTSFTHAADCQHVADPDARGWIPVQDGRMTSRNGIYVAGDGTGIGGVKTAVLEGEVVGLRVASQLGVLDRTTAETRISCLLRKLRRREWYGRLLKEIYQIRPGLYDLLTEDTLICRCEEVSFLKIRAAIRENPADLARMKTLTRIGMGRCQGRFCYPTLLGLLIKENPNRDPATFDFSGRPPVKPLSIQDLIETADPDA